MNTINKSFLLKCMISRIRRELKRYGM